MTHYIGFRLRVCTLKLATTETHTCVRSPTQYIDIPLVRMEPLILSVHDKYFFFLWKIWVAQSAGRCVASISIRCHFHVSCEGLSGVFFFFIIIKIRKCRQSQSVLKAVRQNGMDETNGGWGCLSHWGQTFHVLHIDLCVWMNVYLGRSDCVDSDGDKVNLM